MRIFWVSNAPFAKTGYGVQSALFIPRLISMGHQMACLCFYGLEGGVLNWNGVTCYPKRLHPYGMDTLAGHVRNFNSNVIISLMDSWVFDPQQTQGCPWVPYYPVDHENMPPKVRDVIGQAFARIAMSKHGVKQTNLSGLDCFYLPHAIDTKIYKPYDKMQVREELKLPKDAFIIGTVAMNKGLPARKNFAQLMEAFAAFKRRHTDAIYYMHTEIMGIDNASFNIPEQCNLLGLEFGRDVILPDDYQKYIGFPDDWMAKMYSALDVHLLVSMGEGFGIPIIEAQACGTPVIVGDWTSMGELCFSGRKIDKKDALKYYTALAAYQYIPHPRAIDLALEAEFKKPSPRERARKKALEYDIDYVSKNYLEPIFRELEQGIMNKLGRFRDSIQKINEKGIEGEM